jgi:hypothetical protein
MILYTKTFIAVIIYNLEKLETIPKSRIGKS